MKRATIGLCIFLTACAGASYRPMIDTVGVDMNRYEGDLAQCQAYADRVSGAATQALVGAGIGAALSLGLAIIGGGGYSQSRSAAAGALLGGTAGGFQGNQSQADVVKNCLAGRGYRILQ